MVEAWSLEFSRQARKDAKLLSQSGLKIKAAQLLEILTRDPFETPPRYEKLIGELSGCFSRRINIQHRLVYEVDEERRCVTILRMWTHYE